MERKRGRSKADSNGSKRLCTVDNRDGHFSDRHEEDDDESNDCSQHPDFTAPEHDVSCLLFYFL